MAIAALSWVAGAYAQASIRHHGRRYHTDNATYGVMRIADSRRGHLRLDRARDRSVHVQRQRQFRVSHVFRQCLRRRSLGPMQCWRTGSSRAFSWVVQITTAAMIDPRNVDTPGNQQSQLLQHWPDFASRRCAHCCCSAADGRMRPMRKATRQRRMSGTVFEQLSERSTLSLNGTAERVE